MILLEALTRGVPCITSDCDHGPKEIIRDDANGWLYPVGDIDRLTALMQTVIDNPAILPAPEDVAASAQRFSARAVAERTKLAFASTSSRTTVFGPHPDSGGQLSKN